MKKDTSKLPETKAINYEPLLATVPPEWDCDDCKYYPCTHQHIKKDKNAKLRYNTCGDHSKRGTPQYGC